MFASLPHQTGALWAGRLRNFLFHHIQPRRMPPLCARRMPPKSRARQSPISPRPGRLRKYLRQARRGFDPRPRKLSGAAQPAGRQKCQHQRQHQAEKHDEKCDRCGGRNAHHIQKRLDGARLKLAQRTARKWRTGITTRPALKPAPLPPAKPI